MEQYEGIDIDPAKWLYVPLSRANVLGLVRAAEAGLPSLDSQWASFALGTIGIMNDWLRDVSVQRFDDEPEPGATSDRDAS